MLTPPVEFPRGGAGFGRNWDAGRVWVEAVTPRGGDGVRL